MDEDSLVHELVFRPVRSGNSLEDTVSRLMQTIRLGVVAPGGALPPERELALRFSVSRDTVREAIKELSEAGYLRARRGRYGGTFVADPLPSSGPVLPPAPGELEDLIGLREVLEEGACRLAATRELGAPQRATLWGRLAEVQAASAEDYRRLDSRLHLSIAELAGIPSLVGLIADNRTRINELLDSFPLLARNIEHSNRQHEQIVLAILAGNERGAEAAMHEHLEGSAALLRGFLA
ncbi:FadR/GntR family transcriptional regulator [Protaetiibacter intestinalis]|uniref:FadR family transcriptional regulator n=1 Tax=Protaetiibacter intestinalis TaxID=2419774 RepID=A0A387B498_9MICO|nr:FCD domain-containing protein [Protaetiibacter intestinalis]AYF97137.1 FadR family transcriptional regulator [Protaetiibacter intestinalis]